jgi:tetratricopeptide (TPR) repeat protein
LGQYLNATNDSQGELSLLEYVCEGLEKYDLPSTSKENDEQIIRAFWQRANLYLTFKRFSDAENGYKQALTFLRNVNLSVESRKSIESGLYHQLGIVAQEQRQWEQANTYYQQALDINIEFGDRYAQARTYHQLGSASGPGSQRQWEPRPIPITNRP